MINFVKEEIQRGASVEKITQIHVVYYTAFGVVDTMKQAVEACIEAGLDPMLAIIPVVEFKGDTLSEVMYGRVA